LLPAGKSAFSFFQPDLPGGAFQYLTLPENQAEENTFNKLMTTFTKTMDVGVAKLHVSCFWHAVTHMLWTALMSAAVAQLVRPLPSTF
jgi:hypothetical protein